MFFSDGSDASTGSFGSSQNVDTGAAGFLNIFGSSAESPTDTTSAEPQDGATGADTTSAEATSSEEYTSADDVVAARFAASLEADGYEFPDTDEADETEEAEGYDLSTLSADEIRALAEEHLAARAAATQAQEAQVQEYVRAKVMEAEQRAIASIDARFQQEVLSKSYAHYSNELNTRVAAIVRASRNTDNPDAFIIQKVADATNTVNKARQEWEAAQAADWHGAAMQAAANIRGSVPELRQYAAIVLARRYNLPEAAIADIAHPRRHIDDFDTRAQELAGIAQFAGQERKRSAQQKRASANAALRAAPIRTSATGKPKGGRVPAYRGTAEEGSRIMALFHEE
jgi:hypothetical protein